MNPQNQNWSISRAPTATPTRKFQFQFHQTFYFMYYQKLVFLKVKTAFEVKIKVIFEISEFFYIYCHGHFLATSSLRAIERRPIVIHQLPCSYRTEAITEFHATSDFFEQSLFCSDDFHQRQMAAPSCKIFCHLYRKMGSPFITLKWISMFAPECQTHIFTYSDLHGCEAKLILQNLTWNSTQ